MTEVKQKLETVLLIPTRVKALREEFTISGDTEGSLYSHSRGWYILFEGSRESLFVGAEKPPELNVGDSVFIAIQKPKTMR